jgi:hypothetical protein
MIQRYDPARRRAGADRVASTVMRPIPPLVATAPIAPDALARLRDALVGTRRASELAETMARLQLAGFAVPEPADYDALVAIARRSTLAFEEL